MQRWKTLEHLAYWNIQNEIFYNRTVLRNIFQHVENCGKPRNCHIHSTPPIMKKKMQIFLPYRQLFVKSDISIGEWEIFSAEVFLCYSWFFIKDDFIIDGVECTMVPLEWNVCIDLWHVLPETLTEPEELLQEEERHSLPGISKDGWIHSTPRPPRGSGCCKV